MQKLNSLKENRGITLIVLIITVIVMLILAAVVLNMTIGDNGLIGRAEDATNRHLEAENHELNVLNKIDNKYDEIANRIDRGEIGNRPTTEPTNNPSPTTSSEPTPTPTKPAGKPGSPDESGIYTENSTINGEEGNAFNPEVPKGFKPVDVDDAVWGDGNNPPSEEAVKKGLVIEDGEGNQFVWIAVDGTEVKLGRYVFKSTGVIDESLSKTEPTDQLKITTSSTYYQTEGLKEDTTHNAHAIDIQAFRTSVTSHGGYYIARYEASYGTDEKPNSKISTGTLDSKSGSAYPPTQEGQLWYNITQSNASTACQNMYDNNYGITSDLVNSYAWDTAIVFIQKYSGDTDYSGQTTLSRSLANTGIIGDERCHIHDMAGNCNEWSTETNSSASLPCMYRGGVCHTSVYNTSTRNSASTSDAYNTLTFRPILYL